PMSVYKQIISRRSIRKFKQEEIEPSLLKKFVNAARLAPSASNRQPLEYLVVTRKDLREQIFANVGWAGYIEPQGNPRPGEEPTAYIEVLLNKKISSKADKDIGASCQNITLAALEEGIGCCWIGSFNKKEINKIFKFPENYSLELILALGYLAENPKYLDVDKDSSIKYYKDSSGTLHVPKRKLEQIIHFNSFK
ncbi:MAG: nitroreductase family protein, partial [Actinomycetota bacterium]